MECNCSNRWNIEVKDEDGNKIPSERVTTCGLDYNTIEITIKDDLCVMTLDELQLLSMAIYEEITDGGQPSLMRNYLKIYDKLDEMIEKKML